MALTEADRARIRREIDEETTRRMERAGYSPPQPREPKRSAAEARELHDQAWAKWADSRIYNILDVYTKGVGDALARVRADLRDEFRQFVTGEVLWEEIAGAVKDYVELEVGPLRAELEGVKARLAEAEAKLAAVTVAEPMALPLALPGPWMGTA